MLRNFQFTLVLEWPTKPHRYIFALEDLLLMDPADLCADIRPLPVGGFLFTDQYHA